MPIADVRFALRTLSRNISFSAAALFTLAVGIGATTAIFSVISGLILRPLPFAAPDRLVQVYGTSTLSRTDAIVGVPTLRESNRSFDQLVAYDVSAAFMAGVDGSERVMTVRTDGDFFAMLGVPAMRGRTFMPADGLNVAVVSESFWRRRLNASVQAIGTSLVLDDRSLTIVGVMPDAFQFPYASASTIGGAGSQVRTDVWTPMPRPLTSRSRISNVTGRLKPGVSIAAAEGDLVAINRGVSADLPATQQGRSLRIEPLSQVVVSPLLRRVLFMLFGAVGLLMLLACANVANLSLVRTALRAREVAVRRALGATRGRLVRQFLIESLCLSLTGGLIGLAIALWGTKSLIAAVAGDLPRAYEVGFDWRVFLFLLLMCTAVGALVGVAPAWFAGRADVQPMLQATSNRTTMTTSQRRIRNALVVAEVALAFVLAVGATLLVRELWRLKSTDLGMTTANVVTFHLGQPFAQVSPQKLADIEARVAAVPGVRAAGLSQLLPLQNWGWTANSSSFFVQGQPPPAQDFAIQLRFVTPGYFEALQIGIERGRAFTAADTPDAPKAIMINSTLARRYFGSDDPTGLVTNRGVIVGVVKDFKQINADQPSLPELYTPIAQNWSQVNELGITLIVRTDGRPESLVGPVRAAVRDASPGHAVFNIKTMEQVVDESLSTFTLYLQLMGAFAAIAVILALSGTYGVTAYIANARIREFAIRIALGANSGNVVRLVVVQGVVMTAIGLAVGLLAAYLATPLLQGLPISVRPPDALTTVPTAIAITIVAVVACLIPALRAGRVDPMTALRDSR